MLLEIQSGAPPVWAGDAPAGINVPLAELWGNMMQE